MYTYIQKKTCKCGCGKYPTMSCKGYNYNCAPEDIKEKLGTRKKVAARNKANKNALSRKLHEVQNVVSGAEMQRWFEDRRKEMTGFCANCNGKSSKDSDTYFKYSICHILPKSYVPSCKTNIHNWIELCYFGNGCHPQMDNKLLDLIDMACFDTIVTRFVAMYPDIAEHEKRRIPSVLMQYVGVEK